MMFPEIGSPTTNSPEDLTADQIELDLDIAHKIIALAEAAGADQTEIFMVKGVGTDFSIENNEVKFASGVTEFGMGFRVILDHRLGFGYCTDLDSAELAIKQALATTKLQKPKEFDFISTAPQQKKLDIFDQKILNLSVASGLSRTEEVISSCLDVDKRLNVTAGGVGFGCGSVALVTSSGVEAVYKSSGIFSGVMSILKDTTVSTGFESGHSRKDDLNFTEIGTRAAELTVAGQNPTKVDSGKYPIIFTPDAIAELLEFTIIPALYGEQAMKGETFYSQKISTEVAIHGLSMFDDGTLANGVNTVPMDDEGTPTQKNILIENGVLKSYLFDRLSSLEFDAKTTGNALRAEGLGSGRSYKAAPKTRALNFTLTTAEAPRDDLVAEVENGLIIHELLGAHTANPASGDFAVNSPNLFKIANGTIAGAGKQVMISGNMAELMKHIRAIGNDFKNLSGGLSPVAFRLPSILFDEVKVI
jgi:PmbA protein